MIRVLLSMRLRLLSMGLGWARGIVRSISIVMGIVIHVISSAFKKVSCRAAQELMLSQIA